MRGGVGSCLRAGLREARYLLELALVWPICALVRAVPEAAAHALARVLGRLAYHVLAHDRAWALTNLAWVYGDALPRTRRVRRARAAFEHIVLARVESLRWSREWMRAHVAVDGAEHARAAAEEARSRGLGTIVITAHLGNFELLPPACFDAGWRGVVVYRRQDNWRVERLLAGARAEYLGTGALPRGPGALLELAQRLMRGEGVGLVIDVNTLDDPVFVDVMGLPAASPPGVGALALLTRAPVILAVAIRLPDGRHRLVFEPPFPLIDTGRRRADIAANSAQYQRGLERHILAHPDQYNWPHPRWRRRPDGGSWTLSTPDRVVEAARVRSRDLVLAGAAR